MNETHDHELTDEICHDIDTRALELVGITHGEGSARDVERLVRGMNSTQLVALAISCAAMVDTNKTQTELLAWMNPIPAKRTAQTARHRP